MTPTRSDRFHQRVFDALVSRSLVYNACWEDPAVDRQILQLGPDDDVLVIASAGCNALDYALAGPRSVHAVDANPRQIALLELKRAALRSLEFEDLFKLFGDGFHPRAADVYRSALREQLDDGARAFWDRRIGWFASRRGSFYFHGLSGMAAYGVHRYFRLRPALRRSVAAMFEASSLSQQADIYHREVAPKLWSAPLERVLSSQWLMTLLGVPHPQRKLVEQQHGGRAAGFIREALEYVVTQLPLRSNYFWRVYFTGRYTPECCPEYLKPENASALREGLVERVVPFVGTVTQFLQQKSTAITRFVLLDHMDWMSSYYPDALREEWEWILHRASPGARVLLRSASEAPAYLEQVALGPLRQRLHEHLAFDREHIGRYQAEDRVHTYAGLVIANARA